MIEAAQDSAVPVWQAALHEPVAFATVLLVIVTAGLWISTFLLWRATVRLAKEARETAEDQAEKMERSIAAANQAATAATDQVKIAEDIAKRELRAYLCLQPVRMDEIIEGTEPIRIVFPLENTGSTPANRFLIHWAWEVSSDEPTSKFFADTLAKYPMPKNRDHSIGPRQLKEVPNRIALGAEWIPQILAGQMKLYILGQIHYVDAFESEHITEFFYYYTADLPNRLGQVSFHNKIG